jgi:hypothetical protein
MAILALSLDIFADRAKKRSERELICVDLVNFITKKLTITYYFQAIQIVFSKPND